MDTIIRKLLDDEKIEYAGIIPFSECRVINPSLLERTWTGGEIRSAIMLCVPYYSGEHEGRNVSLYAVPRDYHLYFRELYARLIPRLCEVFPGFSFRGYADRSPIGETGAAAKAGLGVIGDKFQLINPRYGSYTFIGEILTDFAFRSDDLVPVGLCCHCGACSEACPVQEGCFSEMTQRKGEMDPETARLIRETGMVWGCDLCRTCCPMNRNIALTPIPFFREALTPRITEAEIAAMDKNTFRTRAYSWRGKGTLLRNLAVYESGEMGTGADFAGRKRVSPTE